MPKTKDALKILDRLTGNDSQLRKQIERETVNAQVAQLIQEAPFTGLPQVKPGF